MAATRYIPVYMGYVTDGGFRPPPSPPKKRHVSEVVEVLTTEGM